MKERISIISETSKRPKYYSNGVTRYREHVGTRQDFMGTITTLLVLTMALLRKGTMYVYANRTHMRKVLILAHVVHHYQILIIHTGQY